MLFEHRREVIDVVIADSNGNLGMVVQLVDGYSAIGKATPVGMTVDKDQEIVDEFWMICSAPKGRFAFFIKP